MKQSRWISDPMSFYFSNCWFCNLRMRKQCVMDTNTLVECFSIWYHSCSPCCFPRSFIFVPFTPYITKWIRFFMMFHLNGLDANQPSHLTHLTLCDCRLSATMELPGGSDNEVLGDRAALCPFFLAGKNVLKTWWATPKEKPFQSKNLSCKRVCRFWVKGRSKSKPLTLKLC